MIRAVPFLLAMLASSAAFAQVDCNKGLEPLDSKAESRMTATDFIHDVATKEIAFSKAFSNYGYQLSVDLRTLQDDQVDGEFKQLRAISFNNSTGARTVTEVGDTVNTLKRVNVPKRDVDALRDAFTITPDLLANHDIVYSGRQKIDDFRAAVFDILPRDTPSDQRAFIGRTWVRIRDNAIVRICGRVPKGPFGPLRYLVTRARIADQYWFPSVISADENVRADDNDVHVRVDVKYSGYAPR
jgi:hypothetical protein